MCVRVMNLLVDNDSGLNLLNLNLNAADIRFDIIVEMGNHLLIFTLLLHFLEAYERTSICRVEPASIVARQDQTLDSNQRPCFFPFLSFQRRMFTKQ